MRASDTDRGRTEVRDGAMALSQGPSQGRIEKGVGCGYQ